MALKVKAKTLCVIRRSSNSLNVPQALQLLGLSTYILFAGAYLQLRHLTMTGWFLSLIAGLSTEWLVALIQNNPRSLRLSSAFISSSAIFLLIEAESNIALMLLCSVAIVLKRTLIDLSGRHHFNPASLAIIVGIAMAPEHFLFDATRVPVRQDFFVLVLALGSLATIFADRWRLSFCYLFSFVAFSATLALALDPSTLGFRIYRILAPMNLVFCFHMISDPMTSPKQPWNQVATGLALGFMDFMMREFKIYHSTLVAMVLLAGFRGSFHRLIEMLHSSAARSSVLPSRNSISK
jgi:Na+-translocating ferredoxin:NAD+ oxidoreductase RnfD subunit